MEHRELTIKALPESEYTGQIAANTAQYIPAVTEFLKANEGDTITLYIPACGFFAYPNNLSGFKPVELDHFTQSTLRNFIEAFNLLVDYALRNREITDFNNKLGSSGPIEIFNLVREAISSNYNPQTPIASTSRVIGITREMVLNRTYGQADSRFKFNKYEYIKNSPEYQRIAFVVDPLSIAIYKDEDGHTMARIAVKKVS